MENKDSDILSELILPDFIDSGDFNHITIKDLQKDLIALKKQKTKNLP